MKFKKASIFTTLVIAVLMVYALISLFVVHRQTRQLQDRAATLQQQVSEMTQANAELQYQIDHSEDDDTKVSILLCSCKILRKFFSSFSSGSPRQS